MCKLENVQMCKFIDSSSLNKCKMNLIENGTPDAFAHLHICTSAYLHLNSELF